MGIGNWYSFYSKIITDLDYLISYKRFKMFWQCNSYATKSMLSPCFIRAWNSQNVSNNFYEISREVFELCKKYEYFFFLR